jgi:hypothetical protein
MQARVATAGQGAAWLAIGWRLFRAAPLGWIALVFAYTLLMVMLSRVPLFGPVAAMVLVPGFTLSFMAVGRAAERGAPLEFGLFLEGFRNRPREQIALGFVYFVCVAFVLGVTSFAGGAEMSGGEPSGGRGALDPVQLDVVVSRLAIVMALYTPVMMLFWFAPALVGWHSTGVVKALVFSFIACILNWRAFLAYAAVIAVFAFVLPLFALLPLMMMGEFELEKAMSVLVLLVTLAMPTLFGSFYASYRDVFGTPA